jgi:endoglucanase
MNTRAPASLPRFFFPALVAFALVLFPKARAIASEIIQWPEGSTLPLQAVRMLSPEWLIVADDYNDENDKTIYEANKAFYDKALDEQVKLEHEQAEGEKINWPLWKERRTLYMSEFIQRCDQDKRMADPASFTITSKDDPAYTTAKHPSKAVFWMISLGARLDDPNSVMRDTREHQVGHYAYLHLPSPLKEGSTYCLRQWDGRETTFTFSDRTTRNAAIKVNQIGYLPGAIEKYAYIGGWIPTVGALPIPEKAGFEICDAKTGEVAYKGELKLRAKADWKPADLMDEKSGAPYSGEDTYEMAFGDFKKEGEYYIRIPGAGRSAEFLIGKSVYGEPFYVQSRGFYHQRCGTALEKPWTNWERLACHMSPVFPCDLPGNGANNWLDAAGKTVRENLDFEIIKTTGRKDEPGKPYNGGWHDAADYDRRQSHHLSIWDLLGAYELNPAAFTDNQLNIPEKDNKIPDILDEALWGVDIWARMQNPDGSVPGRIETISHPHHLGTPDKEVSDWFYSKPNRSSTMYFAASAAWLSRLLQPFDAKRAETLREQAIRAYQWTMSQPEVPQKMEIELTMKRKGEKEVKPQTFKLVDDPKDHYFPALHAALELYKLTGDQTYKTDIVTKLGPFAVKYFKSYPNQYNYLWCIYDLATAKDMPEDLVSGARAAILEQADGRLAFMSSNPYRHPWNPAKGRRWGGALPATFGKFFVAAYQLTGKPEYLSAVQLCADFHLGTNPIGYSHTTGLGYQFPASIQDAETRTDGIFEPVPGLTPYGIISIPYGTVKDVLRPTIEPKEKGGKATVHTFLPPPYDVEQIPIPLWRRISPHSSQDPLNNEFTVQETLSPAVVMFAALMEPGWMPSEDLKNRKPREPKDLMDTWFRVP